ncbi:NlpC/P60 family protein [Streptomyces sp. NPDC051913]|uniref:C40 family peptidase n=1 Tax=Streptomyces sp. NPDC051913 TaxID=3365676 RepID=UPI0037D4AD54
MRREPMTRHRPRTVVLAGLLCLLAGTTQPFAQAVPRPDRPQTLAEVRAELESLYHDAEVATEEYNAAGEDVAAQEKKLDVLGAQVARADARLVRLRALVGAAARAQYRGGGMPAEVQFALSPDPEHALDAAGLARQAQLGTDRQLVALAETESRLKTRAEKAAEELDGLREIQQTRDTARDKVTRQIAAARKLEARLEADELKHLAALEKKDAAKAQAAWLKTGVLDGVGTKASAGGKKAVAYATDQLGKPYVWGAEGPDSFDCSGLTSQAWLAAGVTIPRTSQEQWKQLKRVAIKDMRPGDLIIYFDDASHVALYVGAGRIIHAPRPGRTITVAPAASMQILGVVRPDPQARAAKK